MILDEEQIEYEDVPTYNGGTGNHTVTNMIPNRIAIDIMRCVKTNADILYLANNELRHVSGRNMGVSVSIISAIPEHIGPIRVKNNTIYYAGTIEEVDVELAKQIIIHDLEVKLLNFNVYMNK